MLRTFAIASLIVAVLSGCKEEPYVHPIYPVEDFEPIFEPKESHIPFPLFVSYDELENLINNAMPIVLVNETNFDKGAIKNAKARLLRTGSVELSKKNERLHMRVPLKADVRPRMTKKILGVDMKVAPKVKAAFYLNLSTSVDFNSEYQITSDLKVESIEWIDDPTVRVVFWDLPITDVVDSLINDQSHRIENILNKVVRTGVNVRKPIHKVWDDMQKPLRINSKVKEVYLLNKPHKLNLGEIVLTDDGIIAQLELFTYVKTAFRSDTSYVERSPLPPLNKVDATRDDFEINFLVSIPLAEASALLEKQFSNEKIDVSGTTLVIKHIYIHTSPDRLLLTTEISRPASAMLRFESTVAFNPVDTSITAANFDYLLVKGNQVVKAAEAVLHSTVLEAIGDDYRISLGNLITQIGPLVEGAIEKGKIGRSLSLSLEDVMMEPTEIVLRPDTILLNVNGMGKVALQILDFKPNKSEKPES
jgi:hypothetical protein